MEKVEETLEVRKDERASVGCHARHQDTWAADGQGAMATLCVPGELLSCRKYDEHHTCTRFFKTHAGILTDNMCTCLGFSAE